MHFCPLNSGVRLMKPTHAQLEDFLANRPVPGIGLAFHDYVNVIEGEKSGDSGKIVGLEDLGPDPSYVVELDSGETLTVTHSHLQHAGES